MWAPWFTGVTDQLISGHRSLLCPRNILFPGNEIVKKTKFLSLWSLHVVRKRIIKAKIISLSQNTRIRFQEHGTPSPSTLVERCVHRVVVQCKGKRAHCPVVRCLWESVGQRVVGLQPPFFFQELGATNGIMERDGESFSPGVYQGDLVAVDFHS